jgi:hypothetical protein
VVDDLQTLRAELKQLQQHQQVLEQRLSHLETTSQSLPLPPSAMPTVLEATPSLTHSSFVAPPPEPIPSPSQWGQIEHWIGLRGFSWLGILALVTGLGMFVRYAYLEGWLGPIFVLLSGLGCSVAMLGLGEWVARKQNYRTWAHALMGGGIALLYFLVYAAYHFSYFQKVTHLNLVSDTLLLMGVVALAIFLALRKQSQSLASRAFLLGFFTSLLSQQLETMTLVYNVLLSVGLAGVAYRCRWPLLAVAGALGSWILHGLWAMSNPHILWAGGVPLLYTALYGHLGERLQAVGQSFWRSGRVTSLVNRLGFVGVVLWSLPHQPAAFSGCLILAWLGIQAGMQWYTLRTETQPSEQQQHLYSLDGALALALVYRWGQLHNSLPPGLLLGLLGFGLAVWAYRGPGRHAEQRNDGLWVWALASWTLAAEMAMPDLWLPLVWALLACAALAYSRERSWIQIAGGLLLLGSQTFLVWTLFPVAAAISGLSSQMTIMAGQAAISLAKAPWLQRLLALSSALTLLMGIQAHLSAHWISLAWVASGCLLLGVGLWRQHYLWRIQGISILTLASARIFIFDLQSLAMVYRILSLVGLGVGLLGMALVYTRLKIRPTGEAESIEQ